MGGYAECEAINKYPAESGMHDEWIKNNLHFYLFPLDTILGEAVEYTYRGDNMGPSLPGIYFLQYDGDIVYVGRASNICQRLASHWRSAKHWSHFWAFTAQREALREIEYMYLAWLRPILNSEDNQGWTEVADRLITGLDTYSPFEAITFEREAPPHD